MIGDVAIFVCYDSADVWTHPEIFRLNDDLSPTVVAGVPPDAFSETGQRWGNPLYNWDVLKAQVMAGGSSVCDGRWRSATSFGSTTSAASRPCWEIPAEEPTAVHGRWVKGPTKPVCALQNALGKLPFIAEDLGLITPEVASACARN